MVLFPLECRKSNWWKLKTIKYKWKKKGGNKELLCFFSLPDFLVLPCPFHHFCNQTLNQREQMIYGWLLGYGKLYPWADILHFYCRLVEEADYKATAELFAKKGDEKSLENFIPKSESDFVEYAELLSHKIRPYEVCKIFVEGSVRLHLFYTRLTVYISRFFVIRKAFTMGLFGFKESERSEEVGKYNYSFPYLSKHRKRKIRKPPFPFFISLLHNHFLTSRVLQLILWSCKSHL